MSLRDTRKFVVADPSMSTLGGHYLEYLKRVVGSAETAGFVGAVACNKSLDLSASASVPWEVLPVFQYDIWGEDPSSKQSDLEKSSPDSRRLARLRNSRIGLLWEMAKNPQVTRHYSQYGLPRHYAKRMRQARTLLEMVNLLLSSKGEEWTKASGSKKGELELATIREALKLMNQGPDVLAGLLKPDSTAEQVEGKDRISASFLHGLETVIKTWDLGENDIVFLPTMAWGDVRGLEVFLKRYGRDKKSPRFALVFRRDIFRQYPDTWREQDYQVHEYRALLAALARVNHGRAVIFTDTDELTSQYNRLFDDVRTLPVPAETLPPPTRDRTSEKPLTLGYLGDARDEKGFALLPDMLNSVGELDDRVSVKLLSQAYVPKRSADVRMLKAIELLRLRTPHKVELAEGALSTEDYRDLIERMDVILVPYDRGNYAARSSGVFMEAVCARRPAIVTAGTWMARILDERTHSYHKSRVGHDNMLGTISSGVLKWAVFEAGVEKSREVGLRGTVTLPSGGSGIHTIIPLSQTATHCWITFNKSKPGDNLFTRVFMAWRDTRMREVHSMHYVLGGAHSEANSLLVPIPKGAVDIWCSFSNAYSATSFDLESLQVTLVKAEFPIARCFGGLTYDDSTGRAKSYLLAQAVCEAANCSAELARSAIELGDELGPKNSPDTLFGDLLAGLHDV
jgi:hypothetical protein